MTFEYSYFRFLPYSAMDNLDLDVIILAHVALTLGAAISVSPAYNFPLALYGLTVAGKAERQFAGLHAVSIVLDLMVSRSLMQRSFQTRSALIAQRSSLSAHRSSPFRSQWLVSGWTEQASSLSIILVVMNMLLKVGTCCVVASDSADHRFDSR